MGTDLEAAAYHGPTVSEEELAHFREQGYLPLGLAHNVKLKNPIKAGQRLKWSDVAYDADSLAVKVRREMEAAFAKPNAKVA